MPFKLAFESQLHFVDHSKETAGRLPLCQIATPRISNVARSCLLPRCISLGAVWQCVTGTGLRFAPEHHGANPAAWPSALGAVRPSSSFENPRVLPCGVFASPFPVPLKWHFLWGQAILAQLLPCNSHRSFTELNLHSALCMRNVPSTRQFRSSLP